MNFWLRDIEAPDFARGVDEPLGCTDPDVAHAFFSPEQEKTGDRPSREHLARTVCSTCPFIIECALHGLANEDYGVWGALGEQDRQALGGRGLYPGARPSVNTVMKRLEVAGVSGYVRRWLVTRWRLLQRRAAA